MSVRTRDKLVRGWCRELETRLRAGEPCRAEEYLARAADLDAEHALELVYTEFVCREEIEATPGQDEYFARFPDLRGRLEEQFLVHQTLHGDPPPRPVTGQTIGPYELVREIGRGGRGAVFQARDTRDGRSVALKLLLSGEYSTPSDLALFRHEAAVLARLDHPHLTRIFEAGVAASCRPYLALEFVEGWTLAAAAAADFRAPTAAAAVVETIARAVHHAHLQGVIHRDLKPSNILLAGGTTPKVSDFGLARVLDAGSGRTRTGDIIGTLGFMAPEQAAGTAHRAGPPADVYALGAILFDLLTGRPPFGSDPTAYTLFKLLNEPPPTPRRLNPAVPRDLETVALKCLEKDPDRRYPTALALADDLRRFLDGKPVTARPAGAATQFARWARRRPAVAAILGVVALVAAVLVGGSLYYNARLSVLLDETATANSDLETALGVAEGLRAETRGQLEDARRALYALQLSQLPALWPREPVRSRRLLTDPKVCPAELRDFTWRYYRKLCSLEERLFPAHKGGVVALAFLPDGRPARIDPVFIWQTPPEWLIPSAQHERITARSSARLARCGSQSLKAHAKKENIARLATSPGPPRPRGFDRANNLSPRYNTIVPNHAGGRRTMFSDHPDTQELLAQARQGRSDAVDRLLDVHREPLRRIIDLRLDPALAARVDASDIVQDVLIEAHRRLEEYLRNPGMPFRLWLRHIAKDHVIDAHRRHRQAQRRSLDREQPLVPAVLADHSSFELAAQLLDGERTPASAAIHRELQRKLDAAVAELDEDDREVILLRHREQMSNQDVAAGLGLTEAAASMRYLRAIRRLRTALLPGSPGEEA